MSDVTAPRPRLGRRPKWRLAARVLVAPAVVIAYLALVLFVAPNVADRVEVQVRTHSAFERVAGDLVYSKAFSDGATVRLIEDALGAVPRLGPLDNINCALGTDEADLATEWDYTLRFSWHGVVVQVASVGLYACHDWTISTLGLPNVLWRPDVSGTAINTVLLATGAPHPPHYKPQAQP